MSSGWQTLLAVTALSLATSCATRTVREIHVPWFRPASGGARNAPGVAGLARVQLAVSPAREAAVRVGVLEGHASAVGGEWRASVWVASFLAALASGSDLTRHVFTLAVDDHIDGPSAGALVAAGFLAALRGDAVDPAVTLTGALGPDGSIASVDGVPEKVVAAAKAGKKSIGVPSGQLRTWWTDRRPADVAALAKEHGIAVVEVGDLDAAYRLLTGRVLPRPPPLAGDELRLPAPSLVTIAARARTLLGGAAAAPGTDGPAVLPLVRRAQARVAEAKAALARGHAVAALRSAARAAGWRRAAARVGALDRVAPPATPRTEDDVERLERGAAAARDDPLLGLWLASAGAEARGHVEVARLLLSDAVRDVAAEGGFGSDVLAALRAAGKVTLPALYTAAADLEVELGELARALSPPVATLRVDAVALPRVARSFASAASGNIEYLDALLLADVAREQRQPLERVRRAFGEHEPVYLAAARLAAMSLAEDERTPQIVRLSRSVASYVDSAGLITKYYALDAELPLRGRARKVEHARELRALLARADLAARRAASTVRSRLGVVPTEAKLYYTLAVELRDGGVSSQLAALRALWRSAFASRVAAMVLARR